MTWEIADAIVALGLFDGRAAPAAPVIQQNGVAAFSRLGVGTYRLELSQPQTPTTTLVLCQPAAGNFAVMAGAAQADGTILIEARDPRDASLIDVPTFLVEVVRAPQSADPTGSLPAPIIPPVGVGSLQTAYNGGNTILETAADGEVTFSSDGADPVANLLVLEGANTVDALRIGTGASRSAVLFEGPIGNIQGEPSAAGSGALGGSVGVRGGAGDGGGAGGTIIVSAGTGGDTGNGGLLQFVSGTGGATSGNGGLALMRAGSAGGGGNGGTAEVRGGAAVGVGSGGHVMLTPGLPAGGGNSGFVMANGAVRFPNLTTAQRNALVGVPTGAQLWNTTTAQLEVWNGAAWVAPGGVSTLQGAYNGGQSIDVTATDGPVALNRDAGDPPDTVLQIVGDANAGDPTAPGLIHLTTTGAPFVSRITTGNNGAGNPGTSLQVFVGPGRTTGGGGALVMVAGAADVDPAGSGDGGNAVLLGGAGPGGTGVGGDVTLGGGPGGLTAGDGGDATLGGGDATVGVGGEVSLRGGASADGAGGNAELFGGAGGTNGAGGNVDVTAGQGAGSGVGGGVFITGGDGDPAGTGVSGPVIINSGTPSPTGNAAAVVAAGRDGGSTSGDGGPVLMSGGDATDGLGGNARLEAGDSGGANNGPGATVAAGAAGTAGTGGDAAIRGGRGGSVSGAGGRILAIAGDADTDGAGGFVELEAGDGAGAAGDGGSLRLVPGAPAGTGAEGRVNFVGPTGNDHSYDRGDRHLASRTVVGTLGVAVVTTAERDAMATPADTCLLVWNTTTGQLEANPANTGWVPA